MFKTARFFKRSKNKILAYFFNLMTRSKQNLFKKKRFNYYFLILSNAIEIIEQILRGRKHHSKIHGKLNFNVV